MLYQTFFLPARGASGAEHDLNRLLGGHRVVSVDKRLVDAGEQSFWAFCVEYLPRNPAEPAPGGGKERVDYKEVLSPADFEVFSRLREERKALAEAEAVPVYAVVTNEQLAEIARRRPVSLTKLREVDGIGEAKAAKYGERMLAVVAAAREPKHAEGGPAV